MAYRVPAGRLDGRPTDVGKVLVIDDEENICKSCEAVLQEEGYEVVDVHEAGRRPETPAARGY